jgi:1,4-alpha-glucan branching enzyme
LCALPNSHNRTKIVIIKQEVASENKRHVERSMNWSVRAEITRWLCAFGLLGWLWSLSTPASAACVYSEKSGETLGNIPYPAGGPYSGVTFRVWAPSAKAVSVTGEFNGWSKTPLCKETPNGTWNEYWSTDFAGATTGQQYRYTITANGTRATFRDPNGRVVSSSSYGSGNSITYDPMKYSWRHKAPILPHPLNTLAIYEMHIGTFNTTEGQGTFQSAISKLPWIQHEGFNAIELIPVAQFDGVDKPPYLQTDPYAVYSDYGGPDNLKALIDAAHSKGLAVIMDVVFSIWDASRDSAVFNWENSRSVTSPGGEYFYNFPDYISAWGSRPNYGLDHIGGPAGYIAGVMRMWVDEYHVDGFRWDSIGNIYNTCSGGVRACQGRKGVPLPHGVSLIQNINKVNSALLNIAEDLTGGAQEQFDTLPLAPGQPGLGFNSQWNGTLAHFFEKDMPGDGAFPLADLEKILSPSSFWNGVGLHNTNFLQSHNELLKPHSRLIEMIDHNTTGSPPTLNALKKETLAASILFTTPGIPMVYQGEEFLDYSVFDRKTPIDWTNETKWSGIALLYQHLIAARTSRSTGTRGLADPDINVYHKDNTTGVIAWDRYLASASCTDDVVVIANLGPTATGSSYAFGLPCPGNWRVIFNSDSQSYNSGFDAVGPDEGSKILAQSRPLDGFAYSTNFSIGKFSVVILGSANR